MIGRWAELLHGQLGMQAKRQLLIPPEEVCVSSPLLHLLKT